MLYKCMHCNKEFRLFVDAKYHVLDAKLKNTKVIKVL